MKRNLKRKDTLHEKTARRDTYGQGNFGRTQMKRVSDGRLAGHDARFSPTIEKKSASNTLRPAKE